MSLYNLEALQTCPRPEDTLAVLLVAMGNRTVQPARRACAAADSQQPEEGLALLKAYVAIADHKVRQAILDVVLSISEGEHGL